MCVKPETYAGTSTSRGDVTIEVYREDPSGEPAVSRTLPSDISGIVVEQTDGTLAIHRARYGCIWQKDPMDCRQLMDIPLD